MLSYSLFSNMALMPVECVCTNRNHARSSLPLIIRIPYWKPVALTHARTCVPVVCMDMCVALQVCRLHVLLFRVELLPWMHIYSELSLSELFVPLRSVFFLAAQFNWKSAVKGIAVKTNEINRITRKKIHTSKYRRANRIGLVGFCWFLWL